MALDDKLNRDSRSHGPARPIARGDGKGNGNIISKSITIANTETEGILEFSANGEFIGFLVEIPDLGTNTLDVEVFPKDATNDEAAIFSSSLTLAESKVHYVHIRQHTTGNLRRFLFGEHTLKVTASGAVTGEKIIKFVEIVK